MAKTRHQTIIEQDEKDNEEFRQLREQLQPFLSKKTIELMARIQGRIGG